MKDDIETLKAWCQWQRKLGPSEEQLELIKAIENVISQAGTWKAKYEQLCLKHYK
jgi:hypothetical protein